MPSAKPASDGTLLTKEQAAQIRQHLEQVLASTAFANGKRAQDFLRLLVEHALAGRLDSLRERMIGAEMFGRPVDYDTANDAVVRVKASEVRRKLAQYYSEQVPRPEVQIELPVGSYVPKFQWRIPSVPVAEATPFVAATTVPERTSRATLWVAGTLLLILVVGALSFSWFWRAGAARPQITSVAILPLLNLSGDSKQDYFADGMTEELTSELSQIGSLRVISRTSTMSYKGSRKTLPEIARELHVDGIVEGSVNREGNHFRITTQLIDARTDRHIWAHDYNRDMASVLEVESEVARAIAAEIRAQITPQEKARLSRPRKVNPEAVDLYLRGIQSANAGDAKRSIDYFKQAIKSDSAYAAAHAALASSYGWMGEAGWMPYGEAFSMEKAEALRAIQLDPSLPEPHLSLGLAVMDQSWDWITQEQEFQQALKLNPNLAAVHWAYAVYLERVGRSVEAVAEAKRAMQSDPVSPLAHANMAYAYYYSRRYDDALAEVRKGVAPHTSLFISGLIYAEQGKYEQAVQEFSALGDAPHALGHMANSLARAGHAAQAREVLSKLAQHVSGTDVGRYETALVYAGLKQNDAAFAALQQALGVRDKGMTFLLIDPCLDPLRSDPRFKALVQSVGFPGMTFK